MRSRWRRPPAATTKRRGGRLDEAVAAVPELAAEAKTEAVLARLLDGPP
jgi:hypothetical protein